MIALLIDGTVLKLDGYFVISSTNQVCYFFEEKIQDLVNYFSNENNIQVVTVIEDGKETKISGYTKFVSASIEESGLSRIVMYKK